MMPNVGVTQNKYIDRILRPHLLLFFVRVALGLYEL